MIEQFQSEFLKKIIKARINYLDTLNHLSGVNCPHPL